MCICGVRACVRACVRVGEGEFEGEKRTSPKRMLAIIRQLKDSEGTCILREEVRGIKGRWAGSESLDFLIYHY